MSPLRHAAGHAGRRMMLTWAWGSLWIVAVLAAPALFAALQWGETRLAFPTRVAMVEVRRQADRVDFTPIFDKRRDCRLESWSSFVEIEGGLRLGRGLIAAPATAATGLFAGDGRRDWSVHLPPAGRWLGRHVTGFGLVLSYRCHPLYPLTRAFRFDLPPG